MGVEELRLGLASVRALAIPPLGAVAINDVARRTSDSDIGSGDRAMYDVSPGQTCIRILENCILEYLIPGRTVTRDSKRRRGKLT